MKVLDLCCGVGGATAGYQRLGWHVTGVDNEEQPHYVGDVFVLGDAIEYCKEHGAKFDFIHASFPCQSHTSLIKGNQSATAGNHVDLIPVGRPALESTGRPWVMENVVTATLRPDLILCGEMFGLGVIRHRTFETSGWHLPQLTHHPHRGRVAGWRHGEYFAGPYFAVYGDGGGKGTLDEWRTAMEMPWPVTRHELSEAIPPAYTEYVGAKFMKARGSNDQDKDRTSR